jgi:hypothetical protein
MRDTVYITKSSTITKVMNAMSMTIITFIYTCSIYDGIYKVHEYNVYGIYKVHTGIQDQLQRNADISTCLPQLLTSTDRNITYTHLIYPSLDDF